MTHPFQDSSTDDAAQPFGWRRLAHLTRDEARARDTHRMAILRHLVAHPGESRQALTDSLALPRSTTATLVSHLLAEGWLHKGEAAAIGRGGRLAAPLHVQPDRLLLLGVEMNLDSVRVVATTLTGELLASERVLQAPDDPHDTLATSARLLLRMHARLYSPDRRVLGIGLGLGGPGLSLLQRLGERLRGSPLQRTPLHLENDAHAAALGEMEFATDGSRTPLLYVNLGASFGASVVVEDGVARHPWQLAREVGHLRLPDEGGRCACGQPGCADTVMTSRSLLPLEAAQRLRQLQHREPQLAGDPDELGHAGQGVGLLLGDLVLAYRPARIVLGGPALALGGAFLNPTLQTLEQRLAASGSDAPAISLARFGAEAVAMGAAALARHRLIRPLPGPSQLPA